MWIGSRFLKHPPIVSYINTYYVFSHEYKKYKVKLRLIQLIKGNGNITANIC